MKVATLFAMFLLLPGISSCADAFDEVDAKLVQQKLAESVKHTAVSWWYAGQDDDFHYIVEKWPMEQMRYKVRKDDVQIDIEVPMGAVLNESDWINLKTTNIQFQQ